MDKVSNFVLRCEQDLDIKLIYKNKIKMYHLKKLLRKLKKIANEEDFVFVYVKDKIK